MTARQIAEESAKLEKDVYAAKEHFIDMASKLQARANAYYTSLVAMAAK